MLLKLFLLTIQLTTNTLLLFPLILNIHEVILSETIFLQWP